MTEVSVLGCTGFNTRSSASDSARIAAECAGPARSRPSWGLPQVPAPGLLQPGDQGTPNRESKDQALLAPNPKITGLRS